MKFSGFKKTIILSIFFLAFLPSLNPFLLAQAKTESLLEQYNKLLKNQYFQLGALLQTVADYQKDRSFSGYNGFSIAATRLRFMGELDVCMNIKRI